MSTSHISALYDVDDTHLICSALVPNTLARSYFVKYGVVIRTLFGCLSPLIPPADGVLDVAWPSSMGHTLSRLGQS